MIFPVLLGLSGLALLLYLGFWQIKRLEWKENIIEEIGIKLQNPVVSVPETFSEDKSQYLPVAASGIFDSRELHVLTSIKRLGPGFRIISRFISEDGRSFLVDRGFIPEEEKTNSRPAGFVNIEGNLFWPNETDFFTPDANKNSNIWFARDIELMSKELETDPVMIVLRASDLESQPKPQPVTVEITNNHLEYAITWFSLAGIWLIMTTYLIFKIKNRSI